MASLRVSRHSCTGRQPTISSLYRAPGIVGTMFGHGRNAVNAIVADARGQAFLQMVDGCAFPLAGVEQAGFICLQCLGGAASQTDCNDGRRQQQALEADGEQFKPLFRFTTGLPAAEREMSCRALQVIKTELHMPDLDLPYRQKAFETR